MSNTDDKKVEAVRAKLRQIRAYVSTHREAMNSEIYKALQKSSDRLESSVATLREIKSAVGFAASQRQASYRAVILQDLSMIDSLIKKFRKDNRI